MWVFFSFFFVLFIYLRNILSTVNRSRKKYSVLFLIGRQGLKLNCLWKTEQNKTVHTAHSPTMQPSFLSPNPQCALSDTLGWACENKTHHPHLPAFAHTFPCTRNAPTYTTVNISTDIIQDPAQPIGHCSEFTFSGLLLHPWPQHLSGAMCSTVMQLICGQRLQMSMRKPDQPWQTLYLAQKVLFSF